MKSYITYLSVSFFLLANFVEAQQAIYTSKAYTVFPDKIVQGNYTSKALSATELISDYKSIQFISPLISFKFSINGKDNEMAAGKDHHFYCEVQNGMVETPLIKFGTQLVENKSSVYGKTLQPGTPLKIRLDMRKVFSDLQKQGYYEDSNGNKIYKNDFKGVFIAGNTAPMIWDFNNLVKHPELVLKDPDGDGIYETVLAMAEAKSLESTAPSWKLTKDISACPQYHSDYKISDALYNLSLEEMQNAIELDSTFRTGKEWAGVWTRDISYSIILSMAVLQPQVAMNSLMRNVKEGRIIQDTGTGGAYPVSSDRMIWAVASWEVYKVTGDKDWLSKAYQIIKKSADDDVTNIYDIQTGMVRGESSFLDWREQTYPKWMQPADIYESECLGTNVVHYQANKILASMADLLKDVSAAAHYNKTAEKIKQGLKKYLWQADKGYYGQYLYGRNFKTLSTKSEALGEALAVLFDAASIEEGKKVISNTPVSEYGIPCIYPQIPGIPPYHNDAVWPFVETYWAMASAKAGNETAVLKSISAIYRPSALFLTNKENFVATSGDYAGTQINSSNMLWSLSGNIALVYKVFFGMHYNENSLEFKPFVPKAFVGKRSLQQYNYRKAILDIDMEGYGNQIKSITIDGKPLAKAIIPASLEGRHSIIIQLANNVIGGTVNEQPDYSCPQTPEVHYAKGKLSWKKIANAFGYRILKDGKLMNTTQSLVQLVNPNIYASYQLIAIDSKGIPSFASEPMQVLPTKAIKQVEAENYASKASLPYSGYSGQGFVNISTTENKKLAIPVKANEAGLYALDFRYANGNGPINTENKCAIRTLTVNGQFAGTIVLPQRGKGEWSDWGFTNSVKVKLNKGANKIILELTDVNTNMNGEVNQAMIDNLRLIKLN